MRVSVSSLRRVFVIVTGLALVLAIGLPRAQGEIFLKIGDIEGSYQDDPYEDYSIIEGYAVNLSIVPDPDDEGSTMLEVSPMWITKQLDLASVYIFSAAWGSENYDYADIFIDSSSSSEADKWTVHWQLRDVSVTSYGSMAGSDPSFAGERFSLAFETVLYEYQEFDDGGAWIGGASFDSDGGGGIMINGTPHNFQFVTQAGANPIPEPSTFVLLGMGAVALAFYRRHRRK